MKNSLKSAVKAGLLGVAGRHMAKRGCILCMHRVLPFGKKSPLSLPRDLEVSTVYLEEIIKHFQALGYCFISMDEMADFLESSSKDRVMAITFDDGYKDNLDFALPICESAGVPMAVYVATNFIDRIIAPWWYSLQSLILERDHIFTGNPGKFEGLRANTQKEKEEAYLWIYKKINEAGIEGRDMLEQVSKANGLSSAPSCDDLMMTWDELRALNDSPLVTIGGHTVSHPRLIWCDDRELKPEIIDSKARLEEELDCNVAHLSYPHGSENDIPVGISDSATEAGYQTAVTTIPRNLCKGDERLLWTLPRKNVSGENENLFELECSIKGLNLILNRRLRQRLKAVTSFQ